VKRLQWQVQSWLTRIGREGTLGLVLLGLGILAYLFILPPLQTRVKQAQADIASLTSRKQALANTEKSKPVTVTDQLYAYYRHFPLQTSAPDLLQKMFAAAKHQHLELLEGKYRIKHERAGSLLRYEITFPVSGNYLQLHKFIATVLTEIPVVALDSVTFERNKISNSLIDAKIRFSLYLGQAT